MKISTEPAVDNLTRAKTIQTFSSENQSIIDMSGVTTHVNLSEMTDENGQPTEEAYKVIVNKLNEFMDYSQKNSKFVFHNDLKRYYVEIVDSKTQDVIKEIPPKKLLDAYYEMQKLIGKMFDKQV